MTWAETYAARLIPYDVSRSAATYGSGEYGGDQSYGQEASDPLANVDYALAPYPGQWPSDYGWEFHVGDVGPVFQAVLLGLNGVESLTVFDSAALILERVSAGPRVIAAFPMTVDTDNDRLEYAWTAGDLTDPGTYRVIVQLVSGTGRPLSVSPTDAASLIVKAVA